LTAAFTVLTVVTIYSFKAKPIYQATARIHIEAETPQVQSLEESYRNLPGTDASFLKTQVRVIDSDHLALQTIQQLGLSDHAELMAQGRLSRKAENDLRVKQGLLLQEFKRRLMVALVPDSRVVEVSFESIDPSLAARVVNALVHNYIEDNFHEKYDATRQASGWMEQQLDELKAKVERSEQALVDYERANAIVNIGDRQNVAEQRLADLDKDLTVALSDRAQKESLYDLVKSDERQVAFVAQNELLQRLEEKYADLKAQYVDVLEQYGPNFPKVLRLADEVKEIQSLIDRERKRTVAQIGNDYKAALGREKLLSASVARQKAEVGRLNQLLIQHNLLKREFESNQQLYASLLKRLKDATVSAGLRATNIHVVDEALPPIDPVRPKKLRSVLVGLAVGLLLGVTLAFVQEALDSSIKTVEDAERAVGLPSLAVIPVLNSSRRPGRGLPKLPYVGAVEPPVALAVLKRSSSHLAESYRTLCTAVLFSTAPRPPQVLLVTSPQPNEGKTCTSLNLAAALAQRGGRVLIVDSDLRKPGISKAFDLPANAAGVTGILTSAYGLDDALQRVDDPNLWVLPSGPLPPNPAELLCSLSMEGILRAARERFDHVILDSPPVLMVTDPTVLSTLVDGVLLVVAGGETTRGALVRSYRTLKIGGARILGLVMNKVNAHHQGYSYYERYYCADAVSNNGHEVLSSS
jgi:capsular exopolysaccharide synthesis family protein